MVKLKQNECILWSRKYKFKLSLYLTESTLHLNYKDQPIKLLRKVIAVDCENHTEHRNVLCE